MRATLSVWVQYLLPQRLLARLVYCLSRSTRPAIKNALIHWFANHYRVDLDEAEERDPTRYASFNEFFTRSLRHDARPVGGDDDTVISPADGVLTEYGAIDSGTLLQTKGLLYSADELLGEAPAGAPALGSFATIYLAPHDYHRVHMPLAGTLTRTRYLPGRRFSVNAATVRRIPGLFCRNERVVAWFDTSIGPMAVVLVGALNVSSISTSWLGEIRSGAPQVWRDCDTPQQHYCRGDEIARFNLGSTVIVLLPAGALTWEAGLGNHSPLRMGQSLGRFRQADDRG